MIARMMVSALALTGVAYAQEPPSVPAAAEAASGRVAYDAAFFAQYNPQTALDMVRQTPGFSLSGGGERRGYAGAVGNLLIDGLRPSTKSQSPDSILSRIPASQVARIELLRGAEVAGDASGQAVLLNVVRTPSAGSGIWEAGFEYNRNRIAPRGELSYSGRSGQIEYGVGGTYGRRFRSQPGSRRIYDSAGALTSSVDTPSLRDGGRDSLSANAAAPLFGGRLSANAQVSEFRFHADNGLFFFDPFGVNTSNLRIDSTGWAPSFELGLDFDREFGPWSLALVGLINRGRDQNDEIATGANGAGAVTSVRAQNSRSDSGETIVRGALARVLGANQRIEFGAEGAFNSLDATLRLTNDTGAGPVAIAVPNSNVLVEEARSEMFAVHSWRPNDHWTLETRLAREQSTLTFTGDTNQTVELAFLKPSVQLSRGFGARNQARFRIYRDVGQLNFNDFVSAAAIADDRIDGGNPDLRPQTSWRAELGADLRFPGDAALNLTLTRYWVEDVTDVVLVVTPGANPGDPPIRFDAPGNIGDADAWSLNARLSLPLRPLVPGARLTVNGELSRTQVTDPVTGQQREISYSQESYINAEFRQDITQWRLAWGLTYSKGSQFQAFRFNEIDTNEDGPDAALFVESTAFRGLKLRAVAENILNNEIRRQRNFFTPDRAGAFARLDERQREFDHDPWLVFELSGTF